MFFVLCSCFGKPYHQADACHLASLHRGFCSIWNTHSCLRLQPHLYQVPVATSVGRSDGTRQRYKSTQVEPDALVRTRIYCRIKVSDRQRRHSSRIRGQPVHSEPSYNNQEQAYAPLCIGEHRLTTDGSLYAPLSALGMYYRYITTCHETL